MPGRTRAPLYSQHLNTVTTQRVTSSILFWQCILYQYSVGISCESGTKLADSRLQIQSSPVLRPHLSPPGQHVRGHVTVPLLQCSPLHEFSQDKTTQFPYTCPHREATRTLPPSPTQCMWTSHCLVHCVSNRYPWQQYQCFQEVFATTRQWSKTRVLCNDITMWCNDIAMWCNDITMWCNDIRLCCNGKKSIGMVHGYVAMVYSCVATMHGCAAMA